MVGKGWFLKICQDYNFIFVKINIYFFLIFEDKRQSNLKTGDVKGEESYKSLKDMVESTAAMAEEAVNCSPNRARTISRSMESDYNIEQFRRYALQNLYALDYMSNKEFQLIVINTHIQNWKENTSSLFITSMINCILGNICPLFRPLLSASEFKTERFPMSQITQIISI